MAALEHGTATGPQGERAATPPGRRTEAATAELTTLAVVGAWQRAANDGDVERLLALSDEDVEVGGPRGTGRGHRLLREWVARAGLHLEPRRTFARADAVVVEQRATWRADPGEVAGRAEVASAFVVVGGRVARVVRHPGLAEALAAAGLGEADEVAGATPATALRLRGIGHVALVTRSLDALAAFYADAFGADLTWVAGGDGGRPRHGFLRVGEATVLHAFERDDEPPGGVADDAAGRPFGRGRIDHVAVEATDADAFLAARDRLVALGRSDGSVTDLGPLVSVRFRDPDDSELELTLPKPDAGEEPPFAVVAPVPREA